MTFATAHTYFQRLSVLERHDYVLVLLKRGRDDAQTTLICGVAPEEVIRIRRLGPRGPARERR
jgi:hypothetical protein